MPTRTTYDFFPASQRTQNSGRYASTTGDTERTYVARRSPALCNSLNKQSEQIALGLRLIAPPFIQKTTVNGTLRYAIPRFDRTIHRSLPPMD